MRAFLSRGWASVLATSLAAVLAARLASAQILHFTEQGDTVAVELVGVCGPGTITTSGDTAQVLDFDACGCSWPNQHPSATAYLVEPPGSRYPGSISDVISIDFYSYCLGYDCSFGCGTPTNVSFVSYPDDAPPEYPPPGLPVLVEDGTSQYLNEYFFDAAGNQVPLPCGIFVQSQIQSTVSVPGNTLPSPSRFALAAPRPNPSRGAVTLVFDVPHSARVSLVVYDGAGRVVRRLVDDSHSPGRYSTSWDGRDRSGREVPPGIYLVRLAAPGAQVVSKVAMCVPSRE